MWDHLQEKPWRLLQREYQVLYINPACSGRVGQGAPVEVLLSWHCHGLSGQDPGWLLATVSANWQALSTQENMRGLFCGTALGLSNKLY